MLEPTIRDFAQAENFGSISFHLPGGQIGTHVMWVHADDEHILINTEVHRAKYRAISADPNVTVTVWDGSNAYRYAEIRGTVVGEVRGQEARDNIDDLSRKYLGTEYRTQIRSERVILKILPVRQRSNGL